MLLMCGISGLLLNAAVSIYITQVQAFFASAAFYSAQPSVGQHFCCIIHIFLYCVSKLTYNKHRHIKHVWGTHLMKSHQTVLQHLLAYYSYLIRQMLMAVLNDAVSFCTEVLIKQMFGIYFLSHHKK